MMIVRFGNDRIFLKRLTFLTILSFAFVFFSRFFSTLGPVSYFKVIPHSVNTLLVAFSYLIMASFWYYFYINYAKSNRLRRLALFVALIVFLQFLLYIRAQLFSKSFFKSLDLFFPLIFSSSFLFLFITLFKEEEEPGIKRSAFVAMVGFSLHLLVNLLIVVNDVHSELFQGTRSAAMGLMVFSFIFVLKMYFYVIFYQRLSCK